MDTLEIGRHFWRCPETNRVFESISRVASAKLKNRPNPGIFRLREAGEHARGMMIEVAGKGLKTIKIIIKDLGEINSHDMQPPICLPNDPSYWLFAYHVFLITEKGKMKEIEVPIHDYVGAYVTSLTYKKPKEQ